MKSSAWLAPDDAPRWIGLDVGGANLKAADGRGRAVSERFELWRRPEGLPDAVRRLRGLFSEPVDGVALTMTGELADGYATKAEGVRAIVAATVEAAAGRPVRVAATDDRWLSPEEANADPIAVAAANWRVAARGVARCRAEGAGLWVDIGSTTTDVIPIAAGRVTPIGLTDTARMQSGELIYTGVRRTPVCAVVDRLPYRGSDCPIAAEWFATTADVWLILGEIDEDPADTATADGRPFTRKNAMARLARCLCADPAEYPQSDALAAAERVAMAQAERLTEAALRRTPDWIVVGGEGSFLARRAFESRWPGVPVEDVANQAGEPASRAFPAHAAAVLAAIELSEGP